MPVIDLFRAIGLLFILLYKGLIYIWRLLVSGIRKEKPPAAKQVFAISPSERMWAVPFCIIFIIVMVILAQLRHNDLR
jgi:hypothetical protein